MAGEIAVDDHLYSHINGEIEMVNDKLCCDISQKLQHLSPISSDITIFKVPTFLHNVNKKAYEPQLVAIGPYHRSKNHLKIMEPRKVHYLKNLLQGKGEKILRIFVLGMRDLEKRARANYEDPPRLDSDKFVEMMLLDACFIVEIVRKYSNTRLMSIDNDSIPKRGWMMPAMRHDLLLVENQLPFFVLQNFYSWTKKPGEESLCKMIFRFFECMVPKPGPVPEHEDNIEDVNHIPGLMHDSWRRLDSKADSMNESKQNSWTLSCGRIPRWFKSCSKIVNGNVTEEHNLSFIRCATELQEAGIKFKRVPIDDLFNIKFKNGIMEIPTQEIDNNSESFFRNLIVYEQFNQDKFPNYVIDYVRFMDYLVNTSKDVEILCQCGIIRNRLGDDKILAKMFNRLCDNVPSFPNCRCTLETYKDVNKHCSRRWNKRIAHLSRNCFKSPWAFISFLAAVFLLLLTSAQTVLSLLAYMYQIHDMSSSRG